MVASILRICLTQGADDQADAEADHGALDQQTLSVMSSAVAMTYSDRSRALGLRGSLQS